MVAGLGRIGKMEAILFKTLWGHQGSIGEAAAQAIEAGFGGIEGPAPEDAGEFASFAEVLRAGSLEWIAEVSTETEPGTYVPRPGRSPQEHLNSLRRGIELAMRGTPRFVNSMAGSDAWSFHEALDFYREVPALAQEFGIAITLETHRGRFFNRPWPTFDILEAVPDLEITCDFSHFCVVAERFVLDEEPTILRRCAERTRHVQLRVGYSQGAQVPDPRAPEYREALEAHERWWQVVFEVLEDRGFSEVTLTPEFGPDGYLQCEPYSQRPVADLWELNRWIGDHITQRFFV
ncbi:MAG: TIM barrel protein [Verrucomicrobiota bacterium]